MSYLSPPLWPNDDRTKRQHMIVKAQTVMFWEQLWPALLPALGVVAIFILLTLVGFWRLLPWITHYAVLGAFAGVLVFLLFYELRHVTWPSRLSALKRLEHDGHVNHAALQALEDKPFTQGDEDNPLWQKHLRDMRQAAKAAALDKPHATSDQKDPFALRYAALLLLFIGFFITRGSVNQLFYTAFHPGSANTAPLTVDMWIDAPRYTGQAPTILATSTTPITQSISHDGIIRVPAGSTLEVRLSGAPKRGFGSPTLTIADQDTKYRATFEGDKKAQQATATLTHNHALILQAGGKTLSWSVAVIEDRPPVVLWREEPETNDAGGMRLAVEIGDDWGISEAFAIIRLEPGQQRALDLASVSDEVLRETERIPLSSIRGKDGAREQWIDLSSLAWAGLEAQLRIEVIDGAGQSESTSTKLIRLPQRSFYNPLAQSIAHERRELAIAPHRWPNTGRALDALTFSPENYFSDTRDYLLLRAAYWDVMNAKGTDVDETVDRLWPLALQLEDEELELARRALAEAQQKLRDALERGADADEINRLIEELRTAMNNYITALAESGQGQLAEGERSQSVEGRDLDDMLNSMRDMSQSGANNAARQLLSELEQMLQNLRIDPSGGGSGPSGGSQSAGGSSSGTSGSGQGGQDSLMGAAGELISKQRELTDDTYSSARQKRNGEGGGRSASDLGQEQSQLRQQLERFQDALGEAPQEGPGSNEGRQARQRLNEALDNMKDAEEALRSGSTGAASMLQTDALDNLRDGAGLLAQSRNAQKPDRAAQGQNQQGQSQGDGFEGQALDPLGRPYQTPNGETANIPDFSNPEMARALIQEIRRRLSEPGRSPEEIEYLERLLEQF